MKEIPGEAIELRTAEQRPDGSTSGPGADDAAEAFTQRTDYPLVVVTTVSSAGERSGCLAGFITQCSIDPIRFLVCISKANHTFEVVTRSEVLALHLLGEDQADVAALFGESTGDEIDKFDGIGWYAGALGVPVLDQCAAWMAVRIMRGVDAGDHAALMTYPVAGGSGSRPGLLTYRSAPPLQAAHPSD